MSDFVIDKILFSREEIDLRVKEIAKLLSDEYRGVSEDIVVICLLRGSLMFTADLSRHIDVPLVLDFMGVSSYGNSTVSSREVKITKELEETIMGKHVIVVEDIIDTGRTLKKIKNILLDRYPKSLKIVTLLDKPSRREVEMEADYVGFVIPDEFVVGYGIDYAQKYRNLPYIAMVKKGSE